MWVVVDGSAKEKMVRPGRRSEGWIEIVEGLKPGDQILADGTLDALPKSSRRPRKPTVKSAATIPLLPSRTRPTLNLPRHKTQAERTDYDVLACRIVRASTGVRIDADCRVVGGWHRGVSALGVDRYPSMDMPTITVRTVYPGAASVEVEAEVSQVLEDAVATVAGIEELRSISSDGTSLLLVTFNLNRNFDGSGSRCPRRCLHVLNRLPPTIDPPIVQKQDTDSSPVMFAGRVRTTCAVRAIHAGGSLRQECHRVGSGVGQVTIGGSADRAVQVNIDARRLAAHQLSICKFARPSATKRRSPWRSSRRRFA